MIITQYTIIFFEEEKNYRSIAHRFCQKKMPQFLGRIIVFFRAMKVNSFSRQYHSHSIYQAVPELTFPHTEGTALFLVSVLDPEHISVTAPKTAH